MGGAQPGRRRPLALPGHLDWGAAGVAPARAVTLALVLTAVLSTVAFAQIVRGAVTEAETGRAVDGAVVRLISADSQQVAMLLTASDGSFVVVAPRGGTHVLEVEHVLYESVRTAPFTVPQTGATARLVRLVRRSAFRRGREGRVRKKTLA
jgi:hypothetical protein